MHLVDALVQKADEGRGGLRYASGRCRATSDPGISEWSNPALQTNVAVLCTDLITKERKNQRTSN